MMKQYVFAGFGGEGMLLIGKFLAMANMLEGKGFCMIEVLSACPTNWGLNPVEALKWLEENMIPYYPLGVYKDKGADAK
jgi:2-oxoglutarate ferredoxin oxidoreductase subunit beta